MLTARSLMITSILTAPLFLTCYIPAISSAQLRDEWDYAKMHDKSDFIVMARANEINDTKVISSLAVHGIKADLQEEYVKMTTVHTIKGANKKEFTVRNNRIVNAVGPALVNPPRVVNFHTKGALIKIDDQKKNIPQPIYLMYLVNGKDGVYDYVTGYYFANDSVKQLIDTSVFADK